MIIGINETELKELVKGYIPEGMVIQAVLKAGGVRGGINVYCEKE